MGILRIPVEVFEKHLTPFLLLRDLISFHRQTCRHLMLDNLERRCWDVEEVWVRAFRHNRPDFIENILKKRRSFHPSTNTLNAKVDGKVVMDDSCLAWAAHYGHDEVVRLLLLDIRVKPSVNDNQAIRISAAQGHAKVVEWLLKQTSPRSRINPAAQENEALRMASRNGHSKVVELLLAHPAVSIDPAANKNEAIVTSSRNGHSDVVELLLKDGRAHPAAGENQGLVLAATLGHTKVVQLLLSDPRIAIQSIGGTRLAKDVVNNVSAWVDLVFGFATACGHLDMIQMLFETFPSCLDLNSNTMTIQLASRNGHSKVVEFLSKQFPSMQSSNVAVFQLDGVLKTLNDLLVQSCDGQVFVVKQDDTSGQQRSNLHIDADNYIQSEHICEYSGLVRQIISNRKEYNNNNIHPIISLPIVKTGKILKKCVDYGKFALGLMSGNEFFSDLKNEEDLLELVVAANDLDIPDLSTLAKKVLLTLVMQGNDQQVRNFFMPTQ